MAISRRGSGGVNIRVGADTSGAVKATEDLARGLDKARKSSESAGDSFEKTAAKLAKMQAQAAKQRERDLVAAGFGKAGSGNNALGQSVSAVKEYQQSLKGATIGVQGLTGAARALGPAIGGGVVAMGAAAVAADKWSQATLDVQNTFNNLPFSIQAARDSTRGLISDMDLARAANQLAALGVAKNSQEFANLAEAAQKLGSKLGMDTTRAFESLGAALGRGSTEMLDNLGIVMKTAQAHEEYARTLGKTTGQLTDAEKAEAFRVVATRKIIEAAKDVTLVTDGAAAATQRYKVELENLATGALGGEDKTRSLKEAMVELAQQGVLPNEKNVRAYGSSLVDLRDHLIKAGVSAEDAFKTKTIEDWLKLIEEAERKARGLELDARLAGDAFTNAIQKVEETTREATRLTLDANLMYLEEQRVIAEGRNADQAELNLLARDELETRFMIAQLEGDAAKQAELRHQMKLADLRSEAAATVAGGAGGRRRAARSGPTADEINANRMMFLAESGQMDRNTQRSMGALGREQNNELAEIDFDAEIDRARELEAAKNEMLLEERMRGIEMQREMGVDPITLIDQELQYKQEAIDQQIAMMQGQAGSEAQILALRNQREQAAHQAKLQRMRAEAVARQRQQKIIADSFTAAASIIGQAQGLITEDNKKANKARAALEAVNLGITATKLAIEGQADIASIVGIPMGIAKLAGAAIALAGIPIVLAQGNKTSPDGGGRTSSFAGGGLSQPSTPASSGMGEDPRGTTRGTVIPVSRQNRGGGAPVPASSTSGAPEMEVALKVSLDPDAEALGIMVTQAQDRSNRLNGTVR